MPIDSLTEKVSDSEKETIVGEPEIFKKYKIVNGYNLSEGYFFIRRLKNTGKAEGEVRHSISEILEKIKDEGEIYYEIKEFIEEKKYNGFGASLYAEVDKKKKEKKETKKIKSKNNGPHSQPSLTHWQKGLQQHSLHIL